MHINMYMLIHSSSCASNCVLPACRPDSADMLPETHERLSGPALQDIG